MYKLYVYLDDPELPPISLEALNPKTEVAVIGREGFMNETQSVYYPAHRIDHIEIIKIRY